ncbi:MAG: hypothetical protein E7L00_03770 [Propionibacteriaceae bacterium]|nr:hypothetical protein [Propionibacteriaceae bacterium]
MLMVQIEAHTASGLDSETVNRPMIVWGRKVSVFKREAVRRLEEYRANPSSGGRAVRSLDWAEASKRSVPVSVVRLDAEPIRRWARRRAADWRGLFVQWRDEDGIPHIKARHGWASVPSWVADEAADELLVSTWAEFRRWQIDTSPERDDDLAYAKRWRQTPERNVQRTVHGTPLSVDRATADELAAGTTTLPPCLSIHEDDGIAEQIAADQQAASTGAIGELLLLLAPKATEEEIAITALHLEGYGFTDIARATQEGRITAKPINAPSGVKHRVDKVLKAVSANYATLGESDSWLAEALLDELRAVANR